MDNAWWRTSCDADVQGGEKPPTHDMLRTECTKTSTDFHDPDWVSEHYGSKEEFRSWSRNVPKPELARVMTSG